MEVSNSSTPAYEAPQVKVIGSLTEMTLKHHHPGGGNKVLKSTSDFHYSTGEKFNFS